MFAIVGITGNTGSAAAHALLGAGHRVRALVRNRARAEAWEVRGVELVEGDASDAADLERAFAGVDGAYVLVPPHPAHPDPISLYEDVATAARSAARSAGLQKLVFLSSEGAHLPDGTGPIRGLHRAEAILAGAAPQLSLLRASYFQENWRPVMGAAREQGVLPTMLTHLDRKRAMVATGDIGRTAAALLLEQDAPALVELAGPEDYSANDAAEACSAALGRSVVPVQPPRDAWVGLLTEAGLGRPYAELLAQMYDGINSGHVRFSGQVVRRHGSLTLAETVRTWTGASAA